jgi:copper homeostasis protein
MTILLEVCVDSPRGLQAAIAGGAHRIELCSALGLGGLSPSPGLVAAAASSPIPVYAMVRPRPGDFVFDAADLAAMRVEIAGIRAAGLAGVVLGVNRSDRTLDIDMLAELVDAAGDLGTTLHRAIDLVPDFPAALESAVDLGFDQILTSGGRLTGIEGADILAALVAQAGDRIAIMAGSGVKPANVAELIARTGVRQVHASCRSPVAVDQPLEVALGFRAAFEADTSAAIVAEMLAAIHS